MDLESESSALESVEENEVNQEKSPHDDENGTKNNGSFANESYYEIGSHGNSDVSTSMPGHPGNAVELVSEELAHLTGKGHAGDSSRTSKGFGLKKWRRIRREIVKDPNTSVDSKILKRGLPETSSSTENQPLPHDIKQNREYSVISSNIYKNVGLIDASAIRGSSSDFRYVLGSDFAVVTDSENSEDHSKSCTAASTPKLGYDMPPVLGYVEEKRRVKNTSSKNLANSTQRFQQGKGRLESSKKPKGERVKMEKENSHSSTYLRSFNFKRGVFSVTTNAKHNGRSIIYDKANSDEAYANEQFHEEVQAGYCNENEHFIQENLAGNLSSDVKEGKSENNQSSTVEDPFIESIRSLQSVQEALEEELQKLGEIRNEPLLPDCDLIKSSSLTADNTAVDPGCHESCLSGQSDVEGIKLPYSSSLELQVLILTQNVNVLESKLKELLGILALKDSRISELETALRSDKLPKEESGSTIGLSEEKFKEVESELEGFFRQKVEAEIEYLVITKMMQNLEVAEGFRLTVLEELETSSKKQAQVLNKLGMAESKAAVFKNQAEELENYCGDILGVEETFMMQKRVCKVTLCFFIQFMLLIMVSWFFVSQLSPSSGVFIPT